MQVEHPPTSRRERLRAQTLAEIREHGYAQIAEGGPAALSLNGIAKRMGMSGPALYRYFASRDELLATLVAESYAELADALADAAAAAVARRRAPRARLEAVLGAYRDWALAAPHRYRLIFESTYGSGAVDRERILPPAQRAMNVILDGFAALPDLAPPTVRSVPLRRDLTRWGETTAHAGAAPGLFLLGQTAWTRLHGLLSLELEGNYAQMAIDPAGLYAGEVEALVQAATSSRTRTADRRRPG